MKKKLFLFLILSLSLPADVIDAKHPPLFASVIDVAKDDILNIRERPDYKAKKVGTQVSDAFLGVERCERIKTSVWCRVYQITQNFYSEDFNPGWVNARYLKSRNTGYVLINGIGNCDYALGCMNGLCEVVSDYDQSENGDIIKLNIISIKREELKGESNFGAMSQEEDGYCTAWNKIQDYIQNNPGNVRGEHISASDSSYLIE